MDNNQNKPASFELKYTFFFSPPFLVGVSTVHKQNKDGLQSNMAAFLAGFIKRMTVHECRLY